MDQKSHQIDQQGLKIYERAKVEFLDLKYPFFANFFKGTGGYRPPLNGKMVKKIAEQKKSTQEYLTSSLICVKTILTPWRQLQIQPLLAFWRSNLKTSSLLGQENFIIAETV